jgi:hypothetical protein
MIFALKIQTWICSKSGIFLYWPKNYIFGFRDIDDQSGGKGAGEEKLNSNG